MPSTPPYRTIPAAAGYPQYSGSLIHPMVGQELIERFYATSVWADISSTNYLGALSKMGDQITFFKEPSVLIRDHIKGGTIKHDTIEAETITLTIDKAKEFSIKIAKVDEYQMQHWEKFKAAVLKNAARALAQQIDAEILGSVYADVHPLNKGVAAGAVSGAYNLGTTGNPVPVNAANVMQVLSDCHSVLNEAQIPKEDRWIVVPTLFENVLLNSDLQNAYITGLSESTMLNGMIPNKIMNFKVYVSDHVSRVFDAGVGDFAYNLMFGTKDAIVFASQLEDTRVIEDRDSWDRTWQGLSVYGFDTVHTEAFGHLYCRFA